MTHGFASMFYRQTDFIPTLIPLCNIVIESLSILFGRILFFIITKNQNNKKFDDFYVSLIFLSIVEIAEDISFTFIGNTIF